ncbi:hypothetical protein [Oceanobacter mangrovi]|uniref:hypothetical protein n=1 Tax=Oceanobacter mangrovi TaxID=2862510 RepID=UPI001C8F0B6F|nr:hypothetical protein [Oceanobacter mangrovi]
MKLALATAISTASLFSAISYAEPVSAAEVEYLTGSLCTLSQRISKDYLAIGADIRPDIAEKDMNDSIGLFEQRIDQLTEYARNSNMKDEFDNLASLWSSYRLDIQAQPTKTNALSMLKDSDALLVACNRVVDLLASQSDSPYAQLLDISEQETTLTQKIARDYYALYWNIDSDHSRTDFQKSVKDFDSNLQRLLSSADNSAETQALLEKIAAQWKFSNAGFQLDLSGQYVPTVISVTTDSIYKKMADVAIRYETRLEK